MPSNSGSSSIRYMLDMYDVHLVDRVHGFSCEGIPICNRNSPRSLQGSISIVPLPSDIFSGVSLDLQALATACGV